MRTSKPRSRGLSLLTLAAFLIAGVCFLPRLGQLWHTVEPAAVATVPTPVEQQKFLTKPIEQIRPGDRVLAHNPERSDDDEERDLPDPNGSTWRLLQLELTAADGHRVDIQLLRPVQWIEEYSAVVGGTVWLDLEELGAVGHAKILTISPCPPIQPGEGRIVTGTFRHDSSDILDVHIHGQPALGCTGTHPFWSEDRQAFIRADQLRAGDRLRTADGQTTFVVSVARRAGTEPVYNLEVDVEHVYYVGQAGVLVHNSCPPIGSGKTHAKAAAKGFPGIKLTRLGGPDFKGTPYLYQNLQPGQRNIVSIQLQGTRPRDFREANRLAGFPGSRPPPGYTWHHVDNYNPRTGRATMQLVRREAHEATYPHRGSVFWYRFFGGQGYD